MKVALVLNTTLENRQYTDNHQRIKCFDVGAYWTVNNLYRDFRDLKIPFDSYVHFNYYQMNHHVGELRKKMTGDFQAQQCWSNDRREIEQIFQQQHNIDITQDNLKHTHWQFYRVVMQFYWFVKTSCQIIQQDDSYTHFFKWRPDSIWMNQPDGKPTLLKFLTGGFNIDTGKEVTQSTARVVHLNLVPGVAGNQIMVFDQYFCIDREAVLRMNDVLHDWVTEIYHQLTSMPTESFTQDVLTNFIYPEAFLGRLLQMARIYVHPLSSGNQLLVRPEWFKNSTVEKINTYVNKNRDQSIKFFKEIS
jgi:hypothetical protein